MAVKFRKSANRAAPYIRHSRSAGTSHYSSPECTNMLEGSKNYIPYTVKAQKRQANKMEFLGAMPRGFLTKDQQLVVARRITRLELMKKDRISRLWNGSGQIQKPKIQYIII
jgi:hypothetical protein